MSRGKKSQEMELGTKQSRTAVNANAKAGEPMPHLTTGIPPGQSATSWEDLGGPTPFDYRPDDDSAELDDAADRIKQVRDAINAKARPAEPMPKMANPLKEDEDLDEDEYIVEDEDEEYDEEEYDEEDYDDEDGEEYDEEGEEEYDEDELDLDDFDVDQDVEALLSGEDELSEEYKEKTKTIFESALRSKVGEIREALEEHYETVYQERLLEEVEAIRGDLEERVDSYLQYVAEEWLKENMLAVQYGIREDITESFLAGMRNLFENHYVDIPEERYDVLGGMVEKLDEMEEKLNEQTRINVQLNRQLSESVADRVFDSVSEGLAITQREKLASLAESVEFESEKEYREKLESLRESYFPTRVITPTVQMETLSEGYDSSPESITTSMGAYLRAASMLSKN
jgi:hypothetical protein